MSQEDLTAFGDIIPCLELMRDTPGTLNTSPHTFRSFAD
jgi:hypothetical protein